MRILLDILLALLILFLIFLPIMIRDGTRFVTREYTVRSSKVRGRHTLVFLTDLHGRKYGHAYEPLLAAIRRANPELVIIGGDLITASEAPVPPREETMASRSDDPEEKPAPDRQRMGAVDTHWCRNAVVLLTELRKKYPIWYCCGNHEMRVEHPESEDDLMTRGRPENPSEAENGADRGVSCGSGKNHQAGNVTEPAGSPAWVQYEAILGKLGITLKRNMHETLESAETPEAALTPGDPEGPSDSSGIVLWSLEADLERYLHFHDHQIDTEYVRSRLGNPDPSRFNVVVTHHPAHFDACAAWGADLCLCGHIHGGILRLPFVGGAVSPDLVLFPKYSGGRYEINFDSNGEAVWRSGRVFRPRSAEKAPRGNRKSVMVLSCGIGFHTIPIRIFNPAELSVIHIEGTEST